MMLRALMGRPTCGHMAWMAGASAAAPIASASASGARPRRGFSAATNLSRVALIGAPVNEGQPITGVEKGPSAFREAGLEGLIRSQNWEFEDLGDIPEYDGLDEMGPGLRVQRGRRIGFKCGQVHEYVRRASHEPDNFVLTLGGDHSIGSATLSGVAANKPDLAVVWVDAHADCNTPKTSPSGNYHGMSLAHALGWFGGDVAGFEWLSRHLKECKPIVEERVALVGIRDLDASERELLKDSGLHVFTMQDIDRHGIGSVMEMALERIDRKGVRPLHLSFDIDACDPTCAPGTGTLARGGLSYREAHYVCERLAATARLGSMDMVEVNIDLDEPGKQQVMHGDDPNIRGGPTVSFAMELIASALGKVIL